MKSGEVMKIRNNREATIELVARDDAGLADRLRLPPRLWVEVDAARLGALLDWKGHGRKLVAGGILDLDTGTAAPADRREELVNELAAMLREQPLAELERLVMERRADRASAEKRAARRAAIEKRGAEQREIDG